MSVFYNRTVTIWNQYTTGDVFEKEVWLPAVLSDVRLLISRGNNIMSSGNSAADSARLHISDSLSSADKTYLSPDEWAAADEETKAQSYTLLSNERAFFTEGDTSAEDPDSHDNFFAYMHAKYHDTFMISNVDRFEIIPHWEVWGK